MVFMSTQEVTDLREAVREIKDQVRALAEVQLQTHRQTLLMRKSLRSCQSHCHVIGSSRWRNLWTAIRSLFSRSGSLPILESDDEIDNELAILASKLSIGSAKPASA